MVDFLFKDPLRGVLSFDQFPYPRSEGELEVDFMVKGALYSFLLMVMGALFLEGGFVGYMIWIMISAYRRNS